MGLSGLRFVMFMVPLLRNRCAPAGIVWASRKGLARPFSAAAIKCEAF
jgi:hypothetical protein